MLEKDCVFCSLRESAPLGKLLQTKHFIAFLDLFPTSPGHSLIVPWRHINSITQLSSEEWSELLEVVQKTQQLIQTCDLQQRYQSMLQKTTIENSHFFIEMALKHTSINIAPDGFNHGVNNGLAAGQTIPHLHWHIIPRYSGDVRDPVGGVRNVIPEKGNYRKLSSFVSASG